MSIKNPNSGIACQKTFISIVFAISAISSSPVLSQPLRFHRDIVIDLGEGVYLIEKGVVLDPVVPDDGIPEIPDYGFPRQPDENEPDKIAYVHFYPGNQSNVLCISVAGQCIGNWHWGSCDLETGALKWFLESLDPNNDAQWLHYDSKFGEGFLDEGMDRLYYRVWQIHGCLEYSGTVVLNCDDIPSWLRKHHRFSDCDQVLVPPPDDDELNPPISLDIVKYDYNTDLPTMDLRERYYLKLIKQDANQNSKPMVLPVDMQLDNPGGAPSVWVTYVYYYGTTNTQQRIYLSHPDIFDLPKDKANNLENWTEGEEGQIRDLTATYDLLVDDADVYHNLFTVTETVEGGGDLVRADEAAYQIELEPGVTAYDITLEGWKFMPDDPNLDPVPSDNNASVGPDDIAWTSKIEGIVVADGNLTANTFFENNPATNEDDIGVSVPGWNSTNSFDIVVTPRDWSLDQSEDIEILPFVLELPDEEITRPPVESAPGYPYANLLSLKLIDGEIREGSDALDGLRRRKILEGPNRDYAYIPSKPFQYNLQRYVYPALLFNAGLNIQNENGCFTFNARQGDQKSGEINWISLLSELQFGLGHNLTDVDTYLEKATQNLLVEPLGPNEQAESFVRMKEVTPNEFREQLWDTIDLIVSANMQAVDDIDQSSIRRRFPGVNAQWPAFVEEAHFCDQYNGQGEFFPAPTNLLRYKDNSVIFKCIYADDNDIGNQRTARFTLHANQQGGPNDLQSNDFGEPSLVKVSGAALYWIFEGGLDELFGQNVDDWVVEGGTLTGLVVESGAMDVMDVYQNSSIRILFCNANYQPVDDEAVFYWEWQTIWYKITGTDGVLQPATQVRFTRSGFVPLNPVWNAVEQEWRGTIDVPNLIPPATELIDGDGLILESSYQGNDYTDEIGLFDPIIDLSSVRNWSNENAGSFVTASGSDPDEDLIIVALRSVNLTDQELVQHFSATVPQSTLRDHNLEFEGTLNLILRNPNNAPPIPLSFVTDNWNLVPPPPLVQGRVFALQLSADALYADVMPDDWPDMANIDVVYDYSLIQDGIDIMRQEYIDYQNEENQLMRYGEVQVGGLLTNRPDDHWHTNGGVNQPGFDIWYSQNNAIPTLINEINQIVQQGHPLFSSGFRCPVRNANISGSSPNSLHIDGRAVDYNIFGIGHSDDAQRRLLSQEFYRVFREFGGNDKTSQYENILYGRFSHSWDELGSSFRLNLRNDIGLHLLKKMNGERFDHFPNPFLDEEWPFLYFKNAQWREVTYTRAHNGIRRP